jgi:hypothetical protein
MMLAGKTFSTSARQAMLVAMALCGLALATASAEAQSVKRIFFNAAGSPINVGRNVNGNQVFTDNRGRFAGATRRTPSGTLIYDNSRRLATVVRNTPSGVLVIDRTTGVTSAIRRTPSGIAFTDDRGRITGGERDPFAAPVFGSLNTFDRAIGDAAPLSVVTVESNSGIAAPGGLQIELSGVKALDVIVSDVTGGTALPNRQTLQDQAALPEPFNDTDRFASFPTGASFSCAGAGCERHGAGS